MNIENHRRNVLTEQLNTAVLRLDQDFRIRYLNPATEALLGVSARRLQGRSWGRLAPEIADVEADLRQALADHNAYTIREHCIRLGPHRSITVDVTAMPLADGLLLELVQVDRRLKIGRTQLRLAQDRTIRTLARRLGAEIAAPLTEMRSAAQMLAAELEDDTLGPHIQVILEASDRLRRLANNLLGPDRATPGLPQPLNIHEVLERVRRIIQAEAPADVQLHRDFDPSIPPLRAAPEDLVQATLNIVRNAVTALDGEGNITLRTRAQHGVLIGSTRYRLALRVDIIDDGPGIPPEIQDAIFYPMVTTRGPGYGLGLPWAQTLVHRNNGVIECHSDPERTMFTLRFPLRP